jgi:hypothetical protein
MMALMDVVRGGIAERRVDEDGRGRGGTAVR